MAELVYAFDLKSNGETRTGSSPVPATTDSLWSYFFCLSSGWLRTGLAGCDFYKVRQVLKRLSALCFCAIMRGLHWTILFCGTILL